MHFEIVTNHQVAYQVKKCFESKVLALETKKGMKLTKIEVDRGYATIHIQCSPATRAQSIFFLGMHAERHKPDVKFDSYGLLPTEEVKKLLAVTENV